MQMAQNKGGDKRDRARESSALVSEKKDDHSEERYQTIRDRQKIPTVWFALKRSIDCRSDQSDVHEPKPRSRSRKCLTRKAAILSGCSGSIATLRGVIHGGERHLERPPSCSPRSIGSNEFLNPVTHEVILSNSRCELKITGIEGCGDDARVASTFLGTLRPGTPGPGFNYRPMARSTVTSRPSSAVYEDIHGVSGTSRPIPGGRLGALSSTLKSSKEVESTGFSNLTCNKCGGHFTKWEAAEEHHLSKHAVTKLVEGDSSRKIVEIICQASWLKGQNNCGRIESVLKVHNMQRTLARFEEYREMVKIRASKLPKKHPRCLADGNELLRFYASTVSCKLGASSSSELCHSQRCNVCLIIRYGFSERREMKHGIGIFTTSTSGRAYESIEISEQNSFQKKALIVCRVIAGRVHRPLGSMQELAGHSGFDSLAGKVGPYSNIEELYLLNPRALLPCFIVICQP